MKVREIVPSWREILAHVKGGGQPTRTKPEEEYLLEKTRGRMATIENQGGKPTRENQKEEITYSLFVEKKTLKQQVYQQWEVVKTNGHHWD